MFVYACVCGVMSVGVGESVMHVGDEGGVHHKIIKNNNNHHGLRTLLRHTVHPQIRRFSSTLIMQLLPPFPIERDLLHAVWMLWKAIMGL